MHLGIENVRNPPARSKNQHYWLRRTLRVHQLASIIRVADRIRKGPRIRKNHFRVFTMLSPYCGFDLFKRGRQSNQGNRFHSVRMISSRRFSSPVAQNPVHKLMLISNRGHQKVTLHAKGSRGSRDVMNVHIGNGSRYKSPIPIRNRGMKQCNINRYRHEALRINIHWSDLQPIIDLNISSKGPAFWLGFGPSSVPGATALLPGDCPLGGPLGPPVP